MELGARANWPDLYDTASNHPVLAHKGKRAVVRRCLDRLSLRARGKPASAAMPEAWLRDTIDKMNAYQAPEQGHRNWGCQLKLVETASVKQLRAMISMAGGSDHGLFEKSELRERARELIAAKCLPPTGS